MKPTHKCNLPFLFLTLALGHQACAKTKAWTDPATAAKENPDFAIQGEYAGEDAGLQVVALGKGQFQAALFDGGLPGAGAKSTHFDLFKGALADGVLTLEGKGGKTITVEGGNAKGEVASLKKTARKSPTLGQKAPDGAVYLFNSETGANAFKPGATRGNYLKEGQVTKDKFQDFHLHLEFRTPFKPDTKPGSQDRGNSGVYIFNNYETQVLDTFGIKAEFNFCGALYRTRPPDVNMCFPPLSWQTYDIHFTAPRFEEGKKVKNARITTIHNGVKIHDDFELKKGTGAGGGRPEKPEAQIYLQGHGNPVSYRNIWILPKK